MDIEAIRFEKIQPIVFLIFIWIWLGTISIISYRHGLKSNSKKFSTEITTSISALLAFIMGFSFSMAVARFEERKTLVVDEANAFSTAYLQSKLIPFKNPERVKNLYLEYLNKRIKAYRIEEPEKLLQDLSRIENDIWSELVLATKSNRGEIEANYSRSVNNLFDTANSRKFSLFKFLPVPFYLLLLIMMSIFISIQSYERALEQNKQHAKAALFVFLLGIVLAFIFDLDHSRKGSIKVGQAPLIELRKNLEGI